MNFILSTVDALRYDCIQRNSLDAFLRKYGVDNHLQTDRKDEIDEEQFGDRAERMRSDLTRIYTNTGDHGDESLNPDHVDKNLECYI